jgi:hypothetical protein
MAIAPRRIQLTPLRPRLNLQLQVKLQHPISMSPLQFIVDAFVNTFGITRPSPQTEARAGRIILLMLAAVLLFICLVAWLLLSVLTH